MPHPTQNQYPTQDQHSTQIEIRHDKIWELIEATPWRDRAKASSMINALNLLRSESLRMDDTAPTTSSALRIKESPSPPVSESFPFNSSTLVEGGLTLCAGGFQKVMGMAANNCSTALPEEPFAFAVDLERGCELKTLGTLPQRGRGRRHQFRNLAPSRMVLLHGVQVFPFDASGLPRQRLHPSQKLSLGGLGSGSPDGRGFRSGRR